MVATSYLLIPSIYIRILYALHCVVAANGESEHVEAGEYTEEGGYPAEEGYEEGYLEEGYDAADTGKNCRAFICLFD